MAGDEELLSVDDKDVFAAALSDTPPAEPEKPSEEPKPEGERPRDEQGRFLPKAEGAETPAPAIPVPGQAANADMSADGRTSPDKPPPEEAIPSWRLREETQRRREAEERLAAASAQLQQFLNQARQQQQRQPEPLPDLIEHPDQYAEVLRNQLRNEFEQRDIARSLHRADRQYGEAFRKAYEAFNAPEHANDEYLLQRVRNSYDPGEAILAWHQEREILREIGPDPVRYRSKLETETQDKLLNDPAFRKKAMDHWRSEATTSRPSSVTSLPNLSRAPGSASGPRDDWPTTDAEIFADVTRRRA